MAGSHLTQPEADALIALDKISENGDVHDYPDLGGSLRIPLTCKRDKESFMLDITRGRIELRRGSFQNRARQNIVLVRLDISGGKHRNPDGELVPCPHIHIYREDFGTKWAKSVDLDLFSNIEDQWQLLQDFMKFCNITDPPTILNGLFT